MPANRRRQLQRRRPQAAGGDRQHIRDLGLSVLQRFGDATTRQRSHEQRRQITEARADGHQDPGHKRPAGYHQWRDLVRVPHRQRGRRTTVKCLARNPIPQLRAVIVPDLGDRLVAQPGTGFDKSPAQIDVLAGVQGLVEAADVAQFGRAADDRRAGHIGDAGVRDDRGFALAKVQRRAHRLIAGYQMVGLGQTDDSRSDQCHGGVTEMTEQSLQPAAARHDVGVQEGDEVRLAGGQTGIACCRRPSALRMPQHLDVAVLPRKVVLLDRCR